MFKDNRADIVCLQDTYIANDIENEWGLSREDNIHFSHSTITVGVLRF